MANWFLNAFLSSFRAQVDKRFPKRTRGSEGTIADRAHELTISQHNDDSDGSVDAWDLDVNLLGSNQPEGSDAERKAMYALLGEFQKQPQAQLWIYRGQIANADVDNWRKRPYTGANAHRKHGHLQSRQSKETQRYTGNLDKVIDAVNAKPSSKGPKPGSRTLKKGMTGEDVGYLQRWLGVKDDGDFGPATEERVRWYQGMRDLTVDGVVGSRTWAEMGVK